MRRIREFKYHSPLIRKLLLANIVVVLLLFVSAKQVKKTHRAKRHQHYQAQQEQHDNLLMLNEAITSFHHYMRFLITQHNLPHTIAQQEHDLTNTKLELLNVATGPHADDLVALPDVIDLKMIYKEYLQSLYPEYFAATTENIIPRQLAKKRIQSMIFAALITKDQEHAQKLWKQIKHSFVSHQLDVVTFLDDNTGTPVIPEDDFNRIMQDTDAYINKHFKTKTNSKPHGFIATIKSFVSKKS